MNFARVGRDCFAVALLLIPLVILSLLPMLIMWSAWREGERMWRGAAELIEKRMRA